MNYLAHLFLAEPAAESLIGSLAGDFVKGSIAGRFTPGVRQGIVEHRKIDEFTDTHPAVAAFQRVIAAEQGHYSRVISDVFFDYFLSCDWDEYSQETRDDFLRRVFATLDPVVDQMPGDLRFVYPRMRGWLASYIEPDGIRAALRNLSLRFSRAPRLDKATHLLTDERDTLRAHFRAFFPDAIDYVKTIRSQR